MTEPRRAAPAGRLARYAEALAAGHRPTVLLTYLGLLAFYGLTAAGNMGETDDAYHFARRPEVFPLTFINDSRLLLYHALMRLLYLATRAIGLDLTTLFMMRTVSALCAAATLILMVRILARHFGVRPLAALAGAATLAITYGFWRYAAEVEVYMPAAVLLTGVLAWLLAVADRPKPGLAAMVGPGVLAGLAVLVYQPNAIALFLAMPLIFLRRDRLLHIVVYGAVGGLVFMGGYALAFLASQTVALSPMALLRFMFQRRGEFNVQPLSLRFLAIALVRATFALGHDIASANWIFGFHWMDRVIQKMFSSQAIFQETYTARHAGWLIYPPLVVLPAFAAAGLLLLWTARPWAAAWIRRPWLDRPKLAALVWLVLEAAIIIRLNASSIEAWIMALLPITLLVTPLLFEPALAAGRRALTAAVVGLLFVHNAVGGMAIVESPSGEYNRVKAAWVLDHATPNDLVVVTGDPDLDEMLDYLGKLRLALIAPYSIPKVADGLLHGHLDRYWVRTFSRRLDGGRLSPQIEKTWKRGGRLIVFDTFFTDGERINRGLYKPEMEELRARFRKVWTHPEAGGTYVLDKPIATKAEEMEPPPPLVGSPFNMPPKHLPQLPPPPPPATPKGGK